MEARGWNGSCQGCRGRGWREVNSAPEVGPHSQAWLPELIRCQAAEASDWRILITWPENWPLIGRPDRSRSRCLNHRTLPAAGKQFNSAWPCNHIICLALSLGHPLTAPMALMHTPASAIFGSFSLTEKENGNEGHDMRKATIVLIKCWSKKNKRKMKDCLNVKYVSGRLLFHNAASVTEHYFC